jgi:hypothetical protein
VVVHGLRGRPSNRKLPAETQRQAVKLLKQLDWHDFGPTFASQQLPKRHGIEVIDIRARSYPSSRDRTVGVATLQNKRKPLGTLFPIR